MSFPTRAVRKHDHAAMHLRHSSIDIFDMHSREHQQLSREAKKYIISRERSDWDWPPRPAPSGETEADTKPAALPPSIRAHAFVDAEPVSWRERYYGTSDDDDGTHDESGPAEKPDAAQQEGFKFENPDSVACVQQRSVKRKRRRKAKLEEELWWNEGLRCFVERRNAWTNARKREDRTESALVLLESSTLLTAKEGAGVQDLVDTNGSSEAVTSLPSETLTVPVKRDGEEPDTEEPASTTEGNDRDALKPPPSLNTRPSSRGRGGKRVARPTPLPGPIPDSDPLIPIPPPLLEASNPIRAAIKPKAYSNIYTQIVQSTRSPVVPIPLADMTRILVAGWKDAGEWPPKGTAPEILGPSARRRTINGREEIIGQLLQEEPSSPTKSSTRRGSNYRGDDGIGGHGISLPAGISIGEGLLSNHNHIRRGVEGVKRVLRLSGSHDKASSPGSHGSEHGDSHSHGTAAVE